MLLSFVSNVLSAWFAFLLPSYATWKAVSHRPVSEQEFERWAMYWSVVGAFVALEYAAGWLISWIPFWWETRTLFLLFLALPQTQGSTWIYVNVLTPYLTPREAGIDAGIVAAQTNILTFIQGRVAKLSQSLWAVATQSSAAGASGAGPAAAGAAPDPFSVAKGLWSTYGPALMTVFQPPAESAHAASARPASYSASSYDVSSESDSAASSSYSSVQPVYPEVQAN
ncbi:TB2/DP1, HVA22 family-domain-containing protein [Amylocystis lapponica]|nr:TB2/DP1, HVA22 family-domain-containing protein [Amylocystis lapponica]